LPVAQFSIILPVRNGGHYIKECVNSILNQSLGDFDLLVLDNKSTDGTLEWLQSLEDERVRLFPSSVPLTIEENWARAVALPKNEFITLIGHDDLLDQQYLATMAALISEFPDASLYQAHFRYIDAAGNTIRPCKPMAAKESGEMFLEKFLRKRIDVNGTGFMMRSKDYDALGGIPLYPNLLFADFELWLNLAKKSYKATSPAECFSFRIHQSTTTVSPDIRYHNAFERFVNYLASLKEGPGQYKKVIAGHAGGFLLFYCRGLSHRLLRTPKKNRHGLSVKQFISKCEGYAILLGTSEKIKPYNVMSIRLARIIDGNTVTRTAFLGFKKLFPKPVMK